MRPCVDSLRNWFRLACWYFFFFFTLLSDGAPSPAKVTHGRQPASLPAFCTQIISRCCTTCYASGKYIMTRRSTTWSRRKIVKIPTYSLFKVVYCMLMHGFLLRTTSHEYRTEARERRCLMSWLLVWERTRKTNIEFRKKRKNIKSKSHSKPVLKQPQTMESHTDGNNTILINRVLFGIALSFLLLLLLLLFFSCSSSFVFFNSICSKSA